ncbi:hypothetical protein, partial [Arcticibacter svalbardensis]|uniref:hypothetical protein n=1 Tax=Arcticibacter svalbardensis TaxID=1288027 RepID=UPI00058CF20F
NYPFLGILPPVWIASLHELAMHFRSATSLTVFYSVLALVAPIVSLIFVVKVLAPGFNQKLSAISSSGEEGTAISSEGQGASKGLMNAIAKRIAPDPIENAGFKITWLLSSRYRDFKVKVYPSFAFVPVYFVYFGFINVKGSLSERWDQLMAGDKYILALYLTSLILTTVMQHVSMTEKYKASWIYFTTPQQQPGKILAGMFKAVIIKFYLPYFAVVSVLSGVLWGPKVINDLLLAFMVGIVFGILVALFQVKGLPFSQPVNIKKGGKIFKTFGVMLVPMLFGFLHYYTARWEWAIWIAVVIMTFMAWLSFSFYRKETWESLELAD